MPMHSHFVEPLERRALLSTSVSGIVFDDLNGNGRRDAGEPGLAGQVLFMDLNTNGQLDNNEPSATSTLSGTYQLSPSADLPQQTVRVRHLVPQGRRLSSPESIFYNVPTGSIGQASGMNFGNTTTAVIRGKVFNDSNGNGLRDSGELGMAGWTVFLDKNDDGIYQPGIEKVRVTNSNGDYRFAGLTPGTYRVRIVQQSEFIRTNPPGGGFLVKNLGFAQSVSNRNFAEQPA